MLYIVSPGSVSMADVGGETSVFWFSRIQENAFLDPFSKNFVFVPQTFFIQQKSGGAMAHSVPGCVGPALCNPIAAFNFIAVSNLDSFKDILVA